MKLYWIGDARSPIFDGEGALRYPGRWHNAGRRLIYCGPNPSCCRLELIANLGRAVSRRPYRLITIEVPDTIVPERPGSLPDGWDHPRDHAVSRKIGDAWFDKGRSLLFQIPSVASPGEYNTLVNQGHPDCRLLKVSDPLPLQWDERIFQSP